MTPMMKLLVTVLVVSMVMTTVESARQRQRQRQLIKSCPEGYELVENPISGKAECTCLPYHLYWPLDGICYRELTQGPCKNGHKLVWNLETEQAECQCPPFWTKLSPDADCYEEYTQGPCDKGQILIQEQCVCSRNMTMHFHQETGQCFELYTRGPCAVGKVLNFNYRSLRPECVCQENHIQWSDGNCYPSNIPSVGPCQDKKCPSDAPVNCFVADSDSLSAVVARCSCLPISSLLDDGHCYPSYNQGPCEYGHWLVYNSSGSGSGSQQSTPAKCLPKKHCQRFDNWYLWPRDNQCYKQWRQGPCPLGKLFFLDPKTGETSCQCRESWTEHLYSTDGQCYEHHSIGPCPSGQYFSYDPLTDTAGCKCFTAFVADPKKNICVEKLTKDRCPLGQLVTADSETGQLKCDCQPDGVTKQHFWPADGKCYQHFTQGPCESSLLFRIDEQTSLPACQPPITSSSFGVQNPPRRKRNFHHFTNRFFTSRRV